MKEINLIHYTKLKERLPVILNEFNKSDFKINVISQHDKEVLTKDELKNFDTDYISPGEISCFMKHLRVYKNLLENLDEEFSIVIEDDILLENNFDFKLSKL